MLGYLVTTVDWIHMHTPTELMTIIEVYESRWRFCRPSPTVERLSLRQTLSD